MPLRYEEGDLRLRGVEQFDRGLQLVSGEVKIASQRLNPVLSLTTAPPPPPFHPIRGDLCERASPDLSAHTCGPTNFESCLCYQRALAEFHTGGTSAEVMLCMKLLERES